jgi:hypothetical protein
MSFTAFFLKWCVYNLLLKNCTGNGRLDSKWGRGMFRTIQLLLASPEKELCTRNLTGCVVKNVPTFSELGKWTKFEPGWLKPFSPGSKYF